MTQRITQANSGLEHKEWRVLKRLSTPTKIQDFLNKLPFDFGPGEKIDRSVRGILKTGKADCVGGAILAAAALWAHGRKPFLLDLIAARHDFDHVVALFKEDGHWGAISKTNHAVLRYREPVYKSSRELALSYFHEYFLPNGQKTLRSFSKPFDLSRLGTSWIIDKENVMDIVYELDCSNHAEILTPKQKKNLRRADKIEIKVGKIVEYK
jgi:hypothetical protein